MMESEAMYITKAIVSSIIFLETISFCYVPSLGSGLSKYRGKWLNERNLNNVTGGALLSLAITHLLPDGFACSGILVFSNVDFRGCVVAAPILVLVTIDFLAGHHCGAQSVAENLSQSLTAGEGALKDDLEEFRRQEIPGKLQFQQSDPSTVSIGKCEHYPSRVDVAILKIKQIFYSRALYLLITFYGHSVLEGALLGIATTQASLWAMAFGIIAHKWAECLVLTSTVMNLIKSKLLRNLCSVVFSLCVPVGILSGSFMDSEKTIVLSSVFQLLAVGFFLYLSFELLTGHNGEVVGDRFVLWVSYIFGAVTMAAILAFSSYTEG